MTPFCSSDFWLVSLSLPLFLSVWVFFKTHFLVLLEMSLSVPLGVPLSTHLLIISVSFNPPSCFLTVMWWTSVSLALILRDCCVAPGILLCVEMFGLQMVCNRGAGSSIGRAECVCAHLYVCMASMHACTWAHLLTRPVHSVNLSESRILEEVLISGDLCLCAHIRMFTYVCSLRACMAPSLRACVWRQSDGSRQWRLRLWTHKEAVKRSTQGNPSSSSEWVITESEGQRRVQCNAYHTTPWEHGHPWGQMSCYLSDCVVHTSIAPHQYTHTAAGRRAFAPLAGVFKLALSIDRQPCNEQELSINTI